MTRRRRLWLSLAIVALLLLLGRAIAGAYADYRWFSALGALDVWRLRFVNTWLLRLLAFGAGTAIAFVNLWGVRHSVVSLVLPRRLGGIEIGEEVPASQLMAVVVVLAVIVGTIFAIPASDWQTFVLATSGVPFGEYEPYLNADLGLYVYWLPFEQSAYTWTVCIVTIVSALVVGLYALTPSLKWERGRIHVSTYVRRHVAVLGGVALALLAWSFRLDAYDSLIHGSAADGAFGAVDQQLGIPTALVLAYVAIGAGFVVAWGGWTGQSRIALTVMTIVLLLTPTLRYVLPVVVRWASTPVPAEYRERGYAGNRAAFTRRAYAVERIRQGQPSETYRSVEEASAVSVWDAAPLARAIERTRRRGPVVSTPALAMSPAGPAFLTLEAGTEHAASSSAAWVVVRTLAAVTDERGTIVRVDEAGRFPLDDRVLPPVRVYPGARGHAVVVDSVQPPAAPAMDSFGGRLAEAWSSQNFRLLGASASGGRIVRLRDVQERVRALLPFFAQGTRVVPIVHGDSLLWALELYSATANFPLSRQFGVAQGDVSYFRHAGTALVQAHTGRVTVLMDGDPDPIARTWMAHLDVTLTRPGMLVPSLLALLPPDIDGTELQAEAFAAVGTRAEGALRRHVPALDGSDTLFTSHAPTFVWMPSLGASAWLVPLVDAEDHVSGVLVATGGVRRELRWFKARDTTTSWGSLLERLQNAGHGGDDRDPRAAGRVRVLPLADGRVLALQPFYGWPTDRAPYVSRVAIALGDTIRVASSIAAAVGAPVTAGPAPATPDAKAERMRVLYAEMRAALQRGDWRAFGLAFDALGSLLERR